jgi:putative Ca2+/H+ antiporter (TMEM165/GDT1 family)
MFPVLIVSYGAVLVSEIAGDKLVYTAGVLASRYPPAPVLFGMTLAFMAKMGVAVIVGDAVSQLPPLLVVSITLASCVWVAYTLWRKDVSWETSTRDDRASKAVVVTFAAVALSEWGDAGQITAAMMAGTFASPAVVWVGAVAAMVTKGALAASVGVIARRWMRERVPLSAIRYASVILVLVLGALSAIEVLARAH